MPRALCLYASDAEIFDFRPGRYRTEDAIAGESEWSRIAEPSRARACDRFVAPPESAFGAAQTMRCQR